MKQCPLYNMFFFNLKFCNSQNTVKAKQEKMGLNQTSTAAKKKN